MPPVRALTGPLDSAAPCSVSGNGRFPYTETTGGLAEIAVGADGARILPEPQEPGQRTRYFAPCDPLLPVVDASMKGRPIKSGDVHRRRGARRAELASMKGRPLRGGDERAQPAGWDRQRASMKGRPLRGGDRRLHIPAPHLKAPR
jgi:hypothetical protein